MFDSLQFVESTDPDGIANELQIAKPKKTATKPSKRRSTYSHKFTLQSQNIPKDPIFSFRLCVNKSDIFIHAGNANLIIQQIRKYDGHVKMYVDRGEKVKVDLNADAIWGAEIRSGEYVIYEFYGEHPPEDSLASDLAKVTNKYTQMDKIV